jgi:hypothetical protein
MLTGHFDAAVRLGWPGCGPVEQMIQFGLGLLLLTENTSILGRSHQEGGSHLATTLQKGKHIGVAVCHMDPPLCRRRRTHLLHRSRPHLAFPWPLLSLSAALFATIGLAGSRLAHPGFSMQQSEHALMAASGDHRQHRMHDKHDPWLLLGLLARLLPDWATDGLMAHPIGSHQTVRRLEIGPVSAHLSGQAALWISGYLGRHAHQAPGASWIA